MMMKYFVNREIPEGARSKKIHYSPMIKFKRLFPTDNIIYPRSARISVGVGCHKMKDQLTGKYFESLTISRKDQREWGSVWNGEGTSKLGSSDKSETSSQ